MERILVEKIISGGQTGVDRGALDFALEMGFECGGWCPRGRIAEDGTIPHRYPLTESDSRKYQVRTRKNVLESDGTLILFAAELSGGTALTKHYAQQAGKPVFLYNLDAPTPHQEVRDWLKRYQITTLNVAGPRESNVPGIAARTITTLNKLLLEE